MNNEYPIQTDLGSNPKSLACKATNPISLIKKMYSKVKISRNYKKCVEAT